MNTLASAGKVSANAFYLGVGFSRGSASGFASTVIGDIPSRPFQVKRALGNHFLQWSLTLGTGLQWRIGYFLKRLFHVSTL